MTPVPGTDFGERARSLQMEIHRDIQARLDAFKKDTGMTPSSVVIEMQNVTTLSDRSKRWTVGGVHVRFEV